MSSEYAQKLKQMSEEYAQKALRLSQQGYGALSTPGNKYNILYLFMILLVVGTLAYALYTPGHDLAGSTVEQAIFWSAFILAILLMILTVYLFGYGFKDFSAAFRQQMSASTSPVVDPFYY